MPATEFLGETHDARHLLQHLHADAALRSPEEHRFLAGFGAQGAITVAAGVEIQMTDGSLDVASFDVLGTEAEPVVITSAQATPAPETGVASSRAPRCASSTPFPTGPISCGNEPTACP